MAKTKSKTISKTQLVLDHLRKTGSITSLEAIELYGATRLSAIIYNLRHVYGFNIASVDERCIDRYGNESVYSRYTL